MDASVQMFIMVKLSLTMLECNMEKLFKSSTAKYDSS